MAVLLRRHSAFFWCAVLGRRGDEKGGQGEMAKISKQLLAIEKPLKTPRCWFPGALFGSRLDVLSSGLEVSSAVRETS